MWCDVLSRGNFGDRCENIEDGAAVLPLHRFHSFLPTGLTAIRTFLASARQWREGCVGGRHSPGRSPGSM